MELLEVDPWYSNDPAHFDLGMLEWGAVRFREFLDVFEGSLSLDEQPQYSFSLQVVWQDRGVAWRRYRLLALMLLTLRGTPVVDGLFGGISQEELSANPNPESDAIYLDHMITLRRNCPALVLGDYRAIESGDEDVFAYVRETEMQRMLVVLNFAGYELDIQLQGTIGAWVAGTHEVYGDGLPPEGGRVLLEPYEGRVYELRRGV